MIGVNLSGAEFGTGMRYGWDYVYPSAGDLDYYAQRGVQFVRLPVRWERLQPNLGGALDTAEVGRLQDFLANAQAAGIKVLVDVHNFGSYAGVELGSAQVPISTFADFWSKLSGAIKDSPALAGYDLMNEPTGFSDTTTWPKAAQAAIDAIRQVDMTHDIYVEGANYATTLNWGALNPGFPLSDPANKIVYEAHEYFDRYDSGTSYGTVAQEGVDVNVGVERLADFAAWLKANNARGFIGEFAVPDSDPAWNTVLENFVKELNKDGISGTYWGAGPWWGDYPLALTNADGSESAQMAVMKKYFGGDTVGTVTDTAGSPPGPSVSHDYVATAAAEAFVGDSSGGSVSYVNSATGVQVDLTAAVQHGGDAEGDTITGIRTITGSAHNDTFTGSAGADVFHAGAGDDLIYGSAGGDTIDGGDGNDTVDYSHMTSYVAVNLAMGFTEQGDSLNSIENVNGSNFDDWLSGTDGINVIHGNAGDDHIGGGGGNDVLYGDAGNDTIWAGDGDDFLDGGPGADLLDGGAGNDTASYAESGAGVQVDLTAAVQHGGDAEGDTLVSIENIIGSSFDDTLTGDSGNNVIQAGAGNDVIHGSGGSDTLDGGSGTDTVIYQSMFHANAVTGTGGDLTIVKATGGTDTLHSIEYVQFKDGVLTTDENSQAAQVARLFQAELGRAPTAAELDTQVHALAHGGTLGTVATAIAAAGDLLGIRAGTSNEAFLDGLYEHVLGRQADAGGKAYWLGVLNAGTSRGDVLSGFVFSIEHLEAATPVAAGGLVVDGVPTTNENSQAAQVARLFQAELGRAPTSAELTDQVHALQHGGTLGTVATAIAASGDLLGLQAGTSNEAFLDGLYEHVLGREADAGGKAYWLGALGSGVSRGDVMAGFVFSVEHLEAAAPVAGGGLFVTDENAQDIASLYHVLGRLPEQGGLDFWVSQMEHGASLQQVADGFASSAEWQSQVSGLSTTDLIEHVYETALGHAADSDALATWTTAFKNGLTQGQFFLDIAMSPEHQALISADIHGGIVTLDGSNAVSAAGDAQTAGLTVASADGADALTGGAGANSYIYTALTQSTPDTPDHITNFRSGTDQIHLDQIDANTLQDGHQDFGFIGTADFGKVAGQLRYQVMGDSVLVQGDVNGDGHADFAIVLDHVHQVTASDFLL